MGLASAGRAGLARDTSTSAGSPAGMTILEHDQLEGGLLGIFVTAEFDSDSTTFDDGDGADVRISFCGHLLLCARTLS